MRPRTLDEFAGQEHFIGEGKLLRRILEADALIELDILRAAGGGQDIAGNGDCQPDKGGISIYKRTSGERKGYSGRDSGGEGPVSIVEQANRLVYR